MSEPTPSWKPTHEVENQAPPLVDYNLYDLDDALREALHREGAGWADSRARAFGGVVGSSEAIAWGFQANRYEPVLQTHDRTGHRIDEVEYHPAYHEVMRLSIRHGIHNLPWVEPREGAHVARATMAYLAGQNEAGHLCPVSMTYSAIPTLRLQPEVAADWEPKLRSSTYDPRLRPLHEKEGALLGMAMTEKQGGSDVRANTTRAVPAGTRSGPGAEYLLTGHKWFCSAPMCDGFLVLAQAPGGLSCFLLPRYTPDGTRNRFFIQRLKNKLGNRSNASSEVEFEQAWARMVGEEGRGVPTIIEMVSHTRLDCVILAASNMRQALTQALHHTAARSAFKRRLIDQPLMQNVLADLAVESEAATLLMMRLARAFDRRTDREFEGPFQRLAMAVSKFWACKRAPMMVGEALECLGGAGYVEESIMPRIYREMPLYSIWEGSGNVNCLDVLRAISREPRSLDALLAAIREGKGQDARLDRYVSGLEDDLADSGSFEPRARRIVEKMALALQGSLLVRHGHPAITEAFLASRLAADWGHSFGTLPTEVDFQAIIDRARGAAAA